MMVVVVVLTHLVGEDDDDMFGSSLASDRPLDF